MSEGNGQLPSGSERLDRIERALELILDDHIQFREEHKLLLNAQVQMQGGLETLRGGLETLRGEVATLVAGFRQFTISVESMRKDFDERLKRIGG